MPFLLPKSNKKQLKQKSEFGKDYELLKIILKSKQDIKSGNLITHEEVKFRLGSDDKKSAN